MRRANVVRAVFILLIISVIVMMTMGMLGLWK
jgi:hypothetical protein